MASGAKLSKTARASLGKDKDSIQLGKPCPQCTTPMVALTRAIGRKRAMEMLLTGMPIDAPTAAEWGLVNRAVAAVDLKAETRKLACRIAEASDLTVAIGKQAFYTQIDLDQSKAYGYAKEVMSMNLMAADAQEGITAFLEKRPACWTGK